MLLILGMRFISLEAYQYIITGHRVEFKNALKEFLHMKKSSE